MRDVYSFFLLEIFTPGADIYHKKLVAAIADFKFPLNKAAEIFQEHLNNILAKWGAKQLF